jgi:hypothetical protein
LKIFTQQNGIVNVIVVGLPKYSANQLEGDKRPVENVLLTTHGIKN